MILLDTNVTIYLCNGTLNSARIKDDVAYASISRIESLGYEHLRANEQLLITALFDAATLLPLTDEVTAWAITLRQAKRMSLGDSIVAATALIHDCTLWTANTDDFRHIEALRLVNPLSQS